MLKLSTIFLLVFVAILVPENSDGSDTAGDTVSWDCPPGDTSCDIQRDDPLLMNCGKFQKYNPSTVRMAPETKGVLGGYDFDGTPAYVGYGANFCDRPIQTPCVGEIFTAKRKDKPPGCYMQCNGRKKFDNETAYFLLNHTGFEWVDTNITHMLTLDTALRLPGLYWDFMYGRIWYLDNWRLGKVHINYKPDLGIRFVDEKGKATVFKEGFQVLTCNKCSNGGRGQYCCLNGANTPDCCLNGGYGKNCTLPCGHFFSFPQNDPADPKTPGLNSGIYEDGSIVYPGIGYFPAIGAIDVARIQTSNYYKGPGAYNAWLSEYYIDQARPKYLMAHKNLRWVRSSGKETESIPGAIKNFLRFGDYWNYDFYARVNYTNENGTFTNIGYHWRDFACSWNGTYDHCTRNDFDILVCAP